MGSGCRVFTRDSVISLNKFDIFHVFVTVNVLDQTIMVEATVTAAVTTVAESCRGEKYFALLIDQQSRALVACIAGDQGRFI